MPWEAKGRAGHGASWSLAAAPLLALWEGSPDLCPPRLLQKPSMTRPIIILVEPQLAENIGMVARAMANFGLSELR